jgi:tRNA A37 threonylcarbamoyladenosine dehydratase
MDNRFDRLQKLVGLEAFLRLQQSHVVVFGLGGVGSWAAEHLARSGIGHLTLVDHDNVDMTNINRQLPALQSTVGQSKVEVLAERFKSISPDIRLTKKIAFFSEENAESFFEPRPDFVVDAIDSLKSKCFLLKECIEREIPMIVSGGAGNKWDPTKIQIKDLNKSHTDPLLQKLRKNTRRHYGLLKKSSAGVPCVFSTELPQEIQSEDSVVGTLSPVTAAFGSAIAAEVVRQLTKT